MHDAKRKTLSLLSFAKERTFSSLFDAFGVVTQSVSSDFCCIFRNVERERKGEEEKNSSRERRAAEEEDGRRKRVASIAVVESARVDDAQGNRLAQIIIDSVSRPNRERADLGRGNANN
tara:strand:+ start:1839 stop:2195 length:357 start_codon:yes stop_codon:yes gene_type:complete